MIVRKAQAISKRPTTSYLPLVTPLLFITLAFASNAWDELRQRTMKSMQLDQIQGAPRTARDDAARWRSFAPPTAPHLAANWTALYSRLAPDEWHKAPILVIRPAIVASYGDFTPVNFNGESEPGHLHGGQATACTWYWRSFEAHLTPTFALDAGGAPTTTRVFVPTWQVGVRTPGFHAGFGQTPRWFGPGRAGSLMLTNNARPAPAFEIGGNAKFRWLGRLSVEGAIGWLPGERHDVDNPGWLVADLRWLPLPAVELGITRTSIFGGFEDGEPRPIDVGEIILPLSPHVYDDPDHSLPDTDEAASWDARLTLPFRHWWGLPIDYLELYIQHGGEDLVTRRAGSLPVPSLAAIANLYGAELAAGPWFAGIEGAIVEDDEFRWYSGHRIYHDGWSRFGRSMGHPHGGDQRSVVVWAGRARADQWGVRLSLERVRRALVAERLADHTFIFPKRELRTTFAATTHRMLPRGGLLAISLQLSPLKNANFVPDANRFEHRLAFSWQPGFFVRRGQTNR